MNRVIKKNINLFYSILDGHFNADAEEVVVVVVVVVEDKVEIVVVWDNWQNSPEYPGRHKQYALNENKKIFKIRK